VADHSGVAFTAAMNVADALSNDGGASLLKNNWDVTTVMTVTVFFELNTFM
jgi:hypothetical protein